MSTYGARTVAQIPATTKRNSSRYSGAFNHREHCPALEAEDVLSVHRLLPNERNASTI